MRWLRCADAGADSGCAWRRPAEPSRLRRDRLRALQRQRRLPRDLLLSLRPPDTGCFKAIGVVTGGDYTDRGTGSSCHPYSLAPRAHHVPATSECPACPSGEYPSPRCSRSCSDSGYSKSFSADAAADGNEEEADITPESDSDTPEGESGTDVALSVDLEPSVLELAFVAAADQDFLTAGYSAKDCCAADCSIPQLKSAKYPDQDILAAERCLTLSAGHAFPTTVLVGSTGLNDTGHPSNTGSCGLRLGRLGSPAEREPGLPWPKANRSRWGEPLGESSASGVRSLVSRGPSVLSERLGLRKPIVPTITRTASANSSFLCRNSSLLHPRSPIGRRPGFGSSGIKALRSSIQDLLPTEGRQGPGLHATPAYTGGAAPASAIRGCPPLRRHHGSAGLALRIAADFAGMDMPSLALRWLELSVSKLA